MRTCVARPREEEVRVRDAQAPALFILEHDELSNSSVRRDDASLPRRTMGGEERQNGLGGGAAPTMSSSSVASARPMDKAISRLSTWSPPAVFAPGNSRPPRGAALQNERGVVSFSSPNLGSHSRVRRRVAQRARVQSLSAHAAGSISAQALPTR